MRPQPSGLGLRREYAGKVRDIRCLVEFRQHKDINLKEKYVLQHLYSNTMYCLRKEYAEQDNICTQWNIEYIEFENVK